MREAANLRRWISRAEGPSATSSALTQIPQLRHIRASIAAVGAAHLDTTSSLCPGTVAGSAGWHLG